MFSGTADPPGSVPGARPSIPCNHRLLWGSGEEAATPHSPSGLSLAGTAWSPSWDDAGQPGTLWEACLSLRGGPLGLMFGLPPWQALQSHGPGPEPARCGGPLGGEWGSASCQEDTELGVWRRAYVGGIPPGVPGGPPTPHPEAHCRSMSLLVGGTLSPSGTFISHLNVFLCGDRQTQGVCVLPLV